MPQEGFRRRFSSFVLKNRPREYGRMAVDKCVERRWLATRPAVGGVARGLVGRETVGIDVAGRDAELGERIGARLLRRGGIDAALALLDEIGGERRLA